MQHPGSIDDVRWQQIFPWLLLVAAARSALLLSVVGISLAGAGATNMGWMAIGWVAGIDPTAWPIEAEPTTGRAALAVSAASEAPTQSSLATQIGIAIQQNPLSKAWFAVVGPWLGIASVEAPHARIYLVCCGIWSLTVWGLAGGAIAWIAALRMTRQENASIKSGLSRAASTWISAIGAPLVTLLAVGVLFLPVAAAGWLLRYEWSAVFVGLAWGLVLLIGLLLVALLVGLLLGWPLMVITAAVDRSDPFDGVSRALAYVYQRPLHLLWYLVVAGVLSAVVSTGVVLAVEATIAVTDRVAGSAAGYARAAELFNHELAPWSWPGWLVGGWRNGLRAGASWFPLGLFWSLTTGIYLLLRFQIDETELDELADAQHNGP